MEIFCNKKLRIGSFAGGGLGKTGGWQIFTLNLLSRLSERGHKVIFFVPINEYKENYYFYKFLNFTVKPVLFSLSSKYFGLPILITRLNLLLKNYIHKIDVWQIMGAYLLDT